MTPEIVLFFVFLSLICSTAANVYLLIQNTKLKKYQSEPSYEAQQLLHDLTRGSGLVKITRVDPSEVFLRSPRH